MSDKMYTPKEAALAVLAKATEIAKKHEHIGWGKLHGKLEHEGYSKDSADKIAGSIKAKLEKADEQEKINANSVAGAQGESMPPMNPMKMSEESNDPHAAQGKTVGDDQNPQSDPQAQQGDKQGGELAKSGTKGHIKLAKFVGRMEHKRGKSPGELDKSAEDPSKMSGKTGMVGSGESGHEMGVHTKGNKGTSQGISNVGARLRDVPHVSAKEGSSIKRHAKESHKTMLSEMKATPKPKLPS